MIYNIDFDNNTAEKYFMDLYHHFEWSESNFERKDLMRTIVCTSSFEGIIRELRVFGANTECGSYEDDGFLRIGYARINNHIFIKNGKANYKELKDALWEIAHPEN